MKILHMTHVGVILGSGSLVKDGLGIMELSGDSSGFSGDTTVEQGTLSVNGRLGGDLLVNSSGRIQGNGVIGTIIVNGVIAPGNSIGTMTVNGNYTQGAGSSYEVEINNSGQSDLITIAGSATINDGAKVLIKQGAGEYAFNTRYTILSALGGLTGKYSSSGFVQDFPFLTSMLNYDNFNVYLDIVRNAVPFTDLAVTPNQFAVATGVESLGAGSSLYNAIVNLPTFRLYRHHLIN